MTNGSTRCRQNMLSAPHGRNLSVVMDQPIPWYASSRLAAAGSAMAATRGVMRLPHVWMSRASAIRASIATDFAPSFRMTLPRCIFTVTSLIDNRDLLVHQPGRHQRHDLPFTGRQQGIPPLQLSNLRALPAPVLVDSNRGGNGVNQILIP